MQRFKTCLAMLLLGSIGARGSSAAEKDLIPQQLPQEQRDNLLRFLQQHQKPDRFIPQGAKIVGPEGATVEANPESASNKPVKQYICQIMLHRPVPGQEQVQRVDVDYYRPNPEAGKPGITVRHTVDLTTGKQVGATQVLLDYPAPISREELTEAVALAREKSAEVQALYKGREANAVQWEYLPVMVNRKQASFEPGDRVVRLAFTAGVAEGQPPAKPVPVFVNLTKGVVVKADR